MNITDLPINEVHKSPYFKGIVPFVPNEAIKQAYLDGDEIGRVTVRKVEDHDYEVVSNHALFFALERCQAEVISAEIVSISDSQAKALVAIEQGHSTNPIDLAEYFEMIIKERFGNGHGVITKMADVYGYKRSTVANSLRLLKLPEDVKQLIRDGKLSDVQGRSLLPFLHTKDFEKYKAALVAGRISTKALEKKNPKRRENRVGKKSAPVSPSPHKRRQPNSDINIQKLERVVSDKLGSPVYIDDKNNVIEIECFNLEIMNAVLKKMGYVEGEI